MLETLTRATFAEHLGSRFRLHYGAAETLEAEIIKVTTLRSPAGRATLPDERESFSLLLLGPKDPCLPQRIYRLEHPQMGSFEIFLVPIGRDEQGTRYEAVFAYAN